MATTTGLLTAEQFFELPDSGRPAELVRGEVVMMNMPGFQHSAICARIAHVLMSFAEAHELGTVVSNDGGVITKRDPDSVRGADIAYYSYIRIPKGTVIKSYPAVPPELVFEVKSPSDRWKDLHSKVAEYLQVGVATVCVVDPESETVIAYFADRPQLSFGRDDAIDLSPILPNCSIPVTKLLST